MSSQTKIQWANYTFNPWEGCTKVSPGCAHCYAEARNIRFFKGANWGPGKPRRRASKHSISEVFRWNELSGKRSKDKPLPRVFPSLCDWLDPEVPIEWLADFLWLIYNTPHLNWLLLTKRPELWKQRMAAAYNVLSKIDGETALWLDCWIPPNPFVNAIERRPRNVWIGASMENQEYADKRMRALLQIPARLRFLSLEPLLGPIILREVDAYWGGIGIDWVIIGGESGPKSRGTNIGWIRDLVEECDTLKLPCFVKQIGRRPFSDSLYTPSDSEAPVNVLGFIDPKDSKGGDPKEWPEDIRIRQFPKI